jgi:hypothetical protein
MAASAESTRNNPADNGSASPCPDVTDEPVVFLLDARDDFEAELLRAWVDDQEPDGDSLYSFARIVKGRAHESLGQLKQKDDSPWLQPLRIAWLPPSGEGGSRTLQNLFHGLVAEPGKLRRRWLAKWQP